MKKVTSLFLAFIVLIGAFAPVAQAVETPFDDVPQNAWFAEAVAWAVSNNVTEGTSGTTFSPHDRVKRSEFVTFLYRIEDEPSVRMQPRFDDVVNPTRYYYRAVQWAAANGITTGYGDGTFRPSNNITREEIATMLFRFARLRGDDLTAPSDALDRFHDRDGVSGWAIESMRWAAHLGIVRGDSRRLLPHDNATRAEALTMTHRQVEKVPFTPPPPTPPAGIDHGSIVGDVTIGPAAPPTGNDERVWNFFRDKGLSTHATAGIMGNLYAESNMRPDIVQRSHIRRIRIDNNWTFSLTDFAALDSSYTNAVNIGTYRTASARIPSGNTIDSRNSFIFDGVGYGLSQWTNSPRKRAMHDFVMARGGGIANLDAQLDFFWEELETTEWRTLQALENVTCVLEASNIVLRQFMRPGDQGPRVQGTRAGFALGYFNRFVR